MWALVHRPAPVSVRDFVGGLARMGLGFGWLSRGFAQGRVRLERRGDDNDEEAQDERFEALKSTTSAAGGKLLAGMQAPLPLTTKPTYRVDTSVNVFNYDCGL